MTGAHSERYPFPFTPDGWYGVGLAAELLTGDVRRLRYFDRELVLFRGGDGRARVFDGHCPHLGAHLGVGGSPTSSSSRTYRSGRTAPTWRSRDPRRRTARSPATGADIASSTPTGRTPTSRRPRSPHE